MPNSSELKMCLMSMFSVDEFAAWMKTRAFSLELVTSLPSLIKPPYFYFDDVIGLLERHGELMSPDFFNELLIVRPRWAAHIATIAGRYGHSGPATIGQAMAVYTNVPDHKPAVLHHWTPSRCMNRLGQLLWYRDNLALDDARRSTIEREFAALCHEMFHAANASMAARAGPLNPDAPRVSPAPPQPAMAKCPASIVTCF